MNVTIITTGGTIAKTFNEFDGSLRNDRPVIEGLIAALRLPDVTARFVHVLNMDSLDMTDADRRLILDAVRKATTDSDAVVVVHGTDTLSLTGEMLCRELDSEPRTSVRADTQGLPPPPLPRGDTGGSKGGPHSLRIPIVLTGAMRPYEFRDSDAVQNVTEAMLACRLAPPGVYVAMHNRLLRFPGVTKDRAALTFVKA